VGESPIIEGLRPLAVPLDALTPMPGNPHHGDVEALMRSWKRFGQRRPIIARRDGQVIAGNHGLEAARRLGWTEIAVAYVDDDEATALAFAAADNRTAQLGYDDQDQLASLLLSVRASDADLFAATAWSESDLARMLIGDEDKPTSARAKARETAPGEQPIESSWAVMVTCTDETSQLELLDRLAGEGFACRALIS
jgi:ParB family chromosome partitioning protein